MQMADYFTDYFYITEFAEEIIFGYNETNKYFKKKDYENFSENIISVKFE